MKKIILVAGIIAGLGLTAQVSASPVFSRQTGMACSACHFQHFPLLNGFGRAFKAAGYTMIGTQAKVEAEGLSIPSTLNMAVMASTGYEKSNQAPGVAGANTTGDGAFYVPGNGGQLSLLFGGRVSSNAGFLAELTRGGAVAGTVVSGVRDSAKLPLLFDLDTPDSKWTEGLRAGFVPFSTDAYGASYGFELLNTGANAVQQMSATPGLNGAHSAVLSAQQYLGTAGAASGIAFVASSPLGFVNLTKYDQTGISQGSLAVLGSTYLRVAALFDLGGWDAGAGFQNWSGSSLSPAGNAATLPATAGVVTTKASAIDAQLQGSLGNLPLGFYASYGWAPANGANAYNLDPAAAVAGSAVLNANGTATRSALNLSVEVGVIPDKATLGAAIRSGRSGDAVGTVSNASDNAITLLATYRLAQNMLATFALTSASGQYWDAAHQNALGSSTTTLNLTALF